jgi:hypothetical protein
VDGPQALPAAPPPGGLEAALRSVRRTLRPLEARLAPVLSAPALPLAALFLLPGPGALVKWLWNLALTLGWGLLSLPELTLGALGILPEKTLRVVVVVPLAPGESVDRTVLQARLHAGLDAAGSALHETARVRLEPAGEHWVLLKSSSLAPAFDRLGCNQQALREDLGGVGSALERLALEAAYPSLFRRLLGLGAPIVVFAVPPLRGFLGCSLGPLTDYVTIDRSDPSCLAHELGHACNLPHHRTPGNLMHPHGCRAPRLERWQALLLRSSRHVSWL